MPFTKNKYNRDMPTYWFCGYTMKSKMRNEYIHDKVGVTSYRSPHHRENAKKSSMIIWSYAVQAYICISSTNRVYQYRTN